MVISAVLMFRRVVAAFRYAVREEDFLVVVGAAASLVIAGTLAYALGEGWNVIDAFYFAVSTLTTTSVADPELVLTERWLKIFTALYLMVGIGTLVELLRRLGLAVVAIRAEERAEERPDQPAQG